MYQAVEWNVRERDCEHLLGVHADDVSYVRRYVHLKVRASFRVVGRASAFRAVCAHPVGFTGLVQFLHRLMRVYRVAARTALGGFSSLS